MDRRGVWRYRLSVAAGVAFIGVGFFLVVHEHFGEAGLDAHHDPNILLFAIGLALIANGLFLRNRDAADRVSGNHRRRTRG